MRLRYLRRALNPLLAPPTDGTPAPPVEEPIVDLPGGAPEPNKGNEQVPTMEIPPEEPPAEPTPEEPPADPNAELLGQLATLQEQNQALMTQLKSINSDNEELEEKNDSILDLEHDDLVAMVSENPHGFVQAMMKEVRGQVMGEVETKSAKDTHNKSIEATIDAYAKDNDDFEGMWDKGDIQSFMQENPGHNAISAHQMLTSAARIASAKDEGIKEAQQNFTNKVGSQTIGSGPAIPNDDTALKDTKKFGGKARVAAQRAGLI